MWESIKIMLQFFLVVAFCFSSGYKTGYVNAEKKYSEKVVDAPVKKEYPNTFEHLHKWTE